MRLDTCEADGEIASTSMAAHSYAPLADSSGALREAQTQFDANHPSLYSPQDPPLRSGTQSLERAISLLRELAARHRTGWRLGDLAARCGIDKGSAHRLLACLIRERLVQQRAEDRRYLPGPLLWELGLSVPGHINSDDACRERLAALARRFGGLAFLMVRSGSEYVCAMRAGDSDLRAVSVEVGTRRPLITSAGGVSILLALPEPEAVAIRANNIQQEISRCGDVRLKALEQMYRRSQAYGFGVNLGDVVPGIHAVAVPVFGRPGKPMAAVCLMSWPEALPESRVDQACEALMAEAPRAVVFCADASHA
ncbi:hypothetical protein CIC12_17620 [Burkholderia sp. SG-MS1]|uniref:IclR family transcriptional regulator n=1 Tax=Paraburkholderia sp. SG-MS1 TaxID=2023741 RepID=UPI001446D7D3|nr:IclR family transcriptional regulator [Paraburkholderia sp. SG-MS1]NKJ48524.1 hypothetical protein [Paraburkholderia sp. SG-MS1]